MKVLKFGGTSVATAERLTNVKNIVEDNHKSGDSLYVVVSAFGGVTDDLIEITDNAKNSVPYIGGFKKFKSKVNKIADSLLSEGLYQSIKSDLEENHNVLENLLSGVALIQEASVRTMDYILSFGERNCAYILSHFLIQEGLPAQYVDARKYIKTDDSYGAARVNFEETHKAIQAKLLDKNTIYVITGFVGSDLVSGRTTTLGRGGSDYSAAIFAAALNAEVLEIWTDVDGVLTSDPRKVKKAYPIDELSYAEAMEMSHFGAKVLYSPTIRPVREKNIPTKIKNTFNPDHPGTLIHHKKKLDNKFISGLSAVDDISLISLEGTGMQGVSGIASRLFKCLAIESINIIMITQASSEHSITIAIKDSEKDKAHDCISVEFGFEIDRKLIDPIKVESENALVAIIGENMKNCPGVAGKLFNILGKNGINIEAIAQGSSELNITFAIHQKDLTKALNTIHDSFFLSEYKTIHLYMIGVGLIGTTLLSQIAENGNRIKTNSGLELVFNGLSNSRKMAFSEDSIPLDDVKQYLTENGETADIEAFVNKMISDNHASSIFVDCTAIAETTKYYEKILCNNIAISTPNKIALSSGLENYLSLKNVAHKHKVAFNYETNVGAGLPVISTLHNLLDSGDNIVKIEAVLSGSLSYIFNTFSSEDTFHSIVKKAQEKGYTEPDPRDDLSGSDVKRKLLILCREAGFPIRDSEINIKSFLSDKAINAKDVESFYSVIESENAYFRDLLENAEKENKRLRFIAVFDKGVGSISLQSVDPSSPFYGLNGSDNMISFTTERYSSTSLVIRGPGAGAEVTAAGVLSEIINMGKSI